MEAGRVKFNQIQIVGWLQCPVGATISSGEATSENITDGVHEMK